MNIVVSSPKPYSREIQISYTADEVREKYETTIDELIAQAHIPGFRKGKVPKGIIIKNYGEAVKSDIAEDLIKDAYAEALEEHNIHPIVPPRMEEEANIELGQDFLFTLKVEVKPDFELKQYKSFELRKIVETVSESEIDETVQELRNRSGMLKPVEGRTAKSDDLVLVDFRPLEDEKPTKRVFKLDESATVVLIGKNAADKVEGHFEFPEDWPDRELAGRIYDAEVEIIELKELVPAEIDDEFLLQFGEDVKSIDDLRGKIAEDIQESKNQLAEDTLRDLARDELIKANPIEHSPIVIQLAVDDSIGRYWDVSKLEEPQLKEIREKLEPKIIRDFSIGYILDEIAAIEKIEVSRDEIKDRVAMIARANNIDPEAYYRYLRKEGDLDSVESDLKAKKAMDIVIENSTIIEEKGK